MIDNPILMLFNAFMAVEKKNDSVVVFDIDKLQILKMSDDDYDKLVRKTLSSILDNYYMKDHPVEVVCEKKVKVISFSKLVLNMVFWRPYFKYRKKIKYEDIIDIPDECTFKRDLTKYIEMTLSKFRDYLDEDHMGELAEIASIIVRDLVRLTDVASTMTLNSFSLYDIINLSKRSPTFNTLNHYRLDPNKSTLEMQDDLAKGKRMVLDAIRSDGKSELFPFIESGVFKDDQLAQSFFSIGLRSDADNKVIPHVINTNFLNGFKNIADYYAECEVARYATIVKDRNVGDSGYLSREFDLLTHSITVDPTVEDCGSKTTIPFHIQNEFQLNMINNKYILLDNGKLKVIDSKKDRDLIGKTVQLRTIVGCKCAAPYVCKTCYGKHEYRQLELNIGACVSINMISRFTNASMSVKHSTTISSMEIEDETILEYFDIIKDQLYLKDSVNTSELSLMFDREYIEDILERNKQNGYDDSDEDDEEGESGSHDPIRRMVLNDKVYDKERDQMIPVKRQIVLEDTYLQFSDQVSMNKKSFTMVHNSPYAVMSLKNFPKDTPLFDITYISKNVSMHIFKIRKAMRCEDVGPFSDIMTRYFRMLTDIIEEAGYRDIGIGNVECIYYGLIKDPENSYMRPNFEEANPVVKLIKMKQAIISNSFTDGLAHEDLGNHFKNINVFKNDSVGKNDVRYAVTNMYDIRKLREIVHTEFPEIL